MNNIQDIAKHTHWIKKSWSNPIVLRFVLIAEIIWAVLSIVGVSFVYRNFVGVGFSLTVIIMGFIVGMDFYVIYWIGWLAFTLRRYQYELNTFSPADSEIISDISGILTARVYILAAFIAIATVIGSTTISEKELMNIFTIPIMLFTWATIITQFLIIRSTLVKIVDKAKWKTLNKIQLKINSIEAKGDMSNKETAEKLLRLADIHKRIMESETRIFDLKSVSTLFSQLMLPLLGLLLGNLDKIQKLLMK